MTWVALDEIEQCVIAHLNEAPNGTLRVRDLVDLVSSDLGAHGDDVLLVLHRISGEVIESPLGPNVVLRNQNIETT